MLSYLTRCQTHVMKLLSELGLETHPQYLQGNKQLQVGQRRVQKYSSAIPNLSLLELVDLQMYISKVNPRL